MDGTYICGLETRARWLAWAEGEGREIWARLGHEASVLDPATDPHAYLRVFGLYRDCLRQGDTYFLNRAFCDLVEHAHVSVPDDLEFDPTWMLSDYGWLWLEDPVEIPLPQQFLNAPGIQKIHLSSAVTGASIQAVGWMKIAEDAYQFLTYQPLSRQHPEKGFGCWTHLTLRAGDAVGWRIQAFEGSTAGQARAAGHLHEIRWIYAAFHLMAQRLAHVARQPTARHIVKIGQQNRRPVTPFFTVISLRRMEAERPQGRQPRNVNWQWQWHVRGHWRNQPYKDGVIRPKFIEAYIKGPAHRPLKAEGHKLFVAAR